MHELMFQAGVKRMSSRSELIPCNDNTRNELASLGHSFYTCLKVETSAHALTVYS